MQNRLIIETSQRTALGISFSDNASNAIRSIVGGVTVVLPSHFKGAYTVELPLEPSEWILLLGAGNKEAVEAKLTEELREFLKTDPVIKDVSSSYNPHSTELVFTFN